MKDIVIKMRFVFPPNMRKYMKNHFGDGGTNKDIEAAIQTLVSAWEEDLSFEYFEAQKAEQEKRT